MVLGHGDVIIEAAGKSKDALSEITVGLRSTFIKLIFFCNY